MDFNTFKQRISGILDAPYQDDGWRLSYKGDTPVELKSLIARIRQQQKELRLLKKEIVADIKEVRAGYDQKAASVRPSAWSVFGNRGYSRQRAADERRSIKADRDKAIAQMESMKQAIDNTLIQLDRAKLEFTEEIDRQKGAS